MDNVPLESYLVRLKNIQMDILDLICASKKIIDVMGYSSMEYVSLESYLVLWKNIEIDILDLICGSFNWISLDIIRSGSELCS